GGHLHLHSFPTRRSSDLGEEVRFGSEPLLASSVPHRKTILLRSGFDPVLTRSCGKGSFLDAAKVPKNDAWDIIPGTSWIQGNPRSEEHTSELQSRSDLVC